MAFMAGGYAENGKPQITNTGARVKPQGMGGYIPKVRSKRGEMGCYTTHEIDDPYEHEGWFFDEEEH
jgi:hypothetical protein